MMQEELKIFIALLNQEIEKYKFGNNPPELYEPIRYIMKLGGKRMRPVLVLLTYKLFSDDDIKKVLQPAIAVEVFHNFTLMHDDIMDQAPLRRGQKTVHEKWNSNIAILSGDTMLVKAYELLLDIEDIHLKKAIRLFNQCACEVCEGQQLDMNFEQRNDVTIEEYLEMIRLKTAVLLGFSLELGGLLAGTSQQNLDKLREIGHLVGIGFQLKDDLLDVFGDQEKFGKQVGGDIIANKKTFLLLNALRLASGETKKELDRLLLTSSEDKVKKVTSIYEQLNIRKITEDKIEECFQKSFQLMNQLEASEEKKKILLDFFDYLINREN